MPAAGDRLAWRSVAVHVRPVLAWSRAGEPGLCGVATDPGLVGEAPGPPTRAEESAVMREGPDPADVWDAGARLALSKAHATLVVYHEVLALNPHRSSDQAECDVCCETKPVTEFVPRPWAPSLHSKTCVGCKAAEADERARLRVEKAEAKRLDRCPSPMKRAHQTKGDALKHIQSLYKAGRGNPDYRPYPCECGVWYVGHSRARLGQRIRASLRGSR